LPNRDRFRSGGGAVTGDSSGIVISEKPQFVVGGQARQVFSAVGPAVSVAGVEVGVAGVAAGGAGVSTAGAAAEVSGAASLLPKRHQGDFVSSAGLWVERTTPNSMPSIARVVFRIARIASSRARHLART
jgi:hypothetical protein